MNYSCLSVEIGAVAMMWTAILGAIVFGTEQQLVPAVAIAVGFVTMLTVALVGIYKQAKADGDSVYRDDMDRFDGLSFSK